MGKKMVICVVTCSALLALAWFMGSFDLLAMLKRLHGGQPSIGLPPVCRLQQQASMMSLVHLAERSTTSHRIPSPFAWWPAGLSMLKGVN